MDSLLPQYAKPLPSGLGQPMSTNAFFEMVYEELRCVAGKLMTYEQSDNTLSATALVNEAYLRLNVASASSEWHSRAHFFSAAAETMRRVLIDRARAKSTLKRKSNRQLVELETLGDSSGEDSDWLLDLDASLEQLAAVDPQAAEFVKLRLFSGRSVVEAGKLLGLSKWSAYQLWDFSLSWFAAHHSEAPRR